MEVNCISFYRKQSGLTQVQLAEKADCSLKQIVNFEHGRTKKMDYNVLQRIANVCGVTVEQLLLPKEEKHDE